jgi:ubiquinone/menaquinone biosynthesis C-methylase UbiE
MDLYTEKTQKFVNDRFNMTIDDIYYSHQPIYGYRNKYSSDSHIARYIITKSILNNLKKYKFSELIDIGGAEGYTAYVIQNLFNCNVEITDFSKNACLRAKEIFNISGTPCDIHNLPFEDSKFEVTLCSETIEHVTDYKKAIEELLRITSKVLIITVPHETHEIVAKNIRDKIPHGHINYFDITTLDYLKPRIENLVYEKTLSPYLIAPRVIAEGYKKPTTKFSFKLYNFLTPLFRKIFGKRIASVIVDSDKWFVDKLKKYDGITFVIEKNDVIKCNNEANEIKSKDFIDITVKEFKIKNSI